MKKYSRRPSRIKIVTLSLIMALGLGLSTQAKENVPFHQQFNSHYYYNGENIAVKQHHHADQKQENKLTAAYDLKKDSQRPVIGRSIAVGQAPVNDGGDYDAPDYDLEEGDDFAFADDNEINDPIEGFNRLMFGFNNFVYDYVFDPVTYVYTSITPDFIQGSIYNLFDFIRTPLYFGNSVLQLDLEGVGTNLSRFLINGTVGILGLFDVATALGIEKDPEDFGQTLGVWGLDHGFYLVLPILGPSSLRDGVGNVGDYFMDPFNAPMGFAETSSQQDKIWAFRFVGQMDQYARLKDTMQRLRDSSADYYTAVKTYYAYNRAAALEK